MAAPGRRRARRASTSFELTDNFHFFTELAQRIIKAASFLGPMGRLYQVDMRLRPTGKSGSLVIPLSEFRRYYESGGAQLWERQALTRARVVYGDAEFGREVMAAVRRRGLRPGRGSRSWPTRSSSMRERLEASGSERDLKRGFGGIVDVEFLVQLFRIKYGKAIPSLRTANTWEALDALGEAGLLSPEEQTTLADLLRFPARGRGRLAHRPQPLARRAAGPAGGRRTSGPAYGKQRRSF